MQCGSENKTAEIPPLSFIGWEIGQKVVHAPGWALSGRKVISSWFCYVRALQLGKCGMGEEGQQRLMETQIGRLTKGPNIGILHRGQQVNLAGIVPVSLIPISLVPIGIQGCIPALHCEGTL